MKERVLKEYIPRSWFHPKGIYKVVERLKPKLPNVNGCLFVTLTLDRNYFKEQWIIPSQAYDQTRGHIRKIFHKLRKGVLWEGKEYKISSPYCVKVEFHDDPEGWPHYHIIWLSRRFVPSELITSLWTHGRTNIKRINNKEFNYILKYVCKSGKVPKWVRRKKGIRIFQSSKGFLKEEVNPKSKPVNLGVRISRKNISTIGDRLDKYYRTALLIDDRFIDSARKYRQVILKDDFKTLLDRLVYPIAQDGRYLGDGKIQIKEKEDFYPWINPTNQ